MKNVNLEMEIENVSENAAEAISTQYVVDQFSDCKTLEDFQEKYREIETRSFNFM